MTIPDGPYECGETGRRFGTTDAARASEARFREVQAQCDAGLVPDLRVGDVIYVDTCLYVSHGRDDFRGGLAGVVGVRLDTSGGIPVAFVCVAQEPDAWHNWPMLASKQKELRERHGKTWAHADPDDRPEFNEW